MESSINKLIEVAGDKASQIGYYWFLNEMMGYFFNIVISIMVFYIVLRIVKHHMQLSKREMLLAERQHDDKILRNILSDQEYRNRFKNWPKIAIEELDEL